jgi:hypothetical protein
VCGSRNGLLVDEMSNKLVDLGHTHFTWVALVMVEDILADPADVGFFGAQGVMAVAQELAVLVEQFLGFPR